MSRRFPLAGLLRVRTLAEDRAAAALADAHRRRRLAQESTTRAAARLRGAALDQDADALAWQAAVAARAALSGLLVETEEAQTAADADVARATDAWSAARRATRAVDRLAERHHEAVVQEELRDEQKVLDEIAGRGPLPSARTTEEGA